MRTDLQSLPTAVSLASTIRQQEPLIAERLGIPLYQVMEQAGLESFQLMRQQWPQAQKIVVLCGAGNNAGDGYVLARLAQQAGLAVTVLQLPKTLQGDAVTAQQHWLNSGGSISSIDQDWPQADLFVDALLGTGIKGELRPELVRFINQLNSYQTPVLALDLPSGLNAETGAVATVAVNATHTITFVGTKLGLLTGAAANHVGRLHLAPLQLGSDLSVDGTLLKPKALNTFSPRQANSHKGQHGRLLILGGGEGMAGAVRLAGEAALRSGAGLVAVGCHQNSVAPTVTARPELMVSADEETIIERISWADVIAIGTGLGQGSWAQHLWQQAQDSGKRLVVDADALNLLANEPHHSDNWILTPHPGEAARLLGISIAEVEANRLNVATTLQRKYGGIVVLKGAGTLIVDSAGWAVAPVGNSGLATGGSGDVLSGILAGLMAQSLTLEQAARLAVLIHGEAADSAIGAGCRGMLPSDLFEYIRYWVNQGKL